MGLFGAAAVVLLAPALARAQASSDAPVLAKESAPDLTQTLSGGAPLNDPNVAVHIVEKKQFRDEGRAELVLFPAVAQVNGEFTQSYGTAASLLYHVEENLALELTPIYHWYTESSAFNRELNASISGEGRPASSLLLAYGGELGVEVTPLYGKFAFYDSLLARFSVVIHAGAGVASTRHELKEGNAFGASTFGDTGARFLGAVGGGLRFQIGDRFVLRLELRDLVYTARVDRVNGCSAEDLGRLIDARAQGSLGSAAVSGTCRVAAFEGTDPRTGYSRENDLVTARELTLDRSSDVLNNLGVYAGFGFVF